MSDKPPIPRAFHEVQGWRESFRAAAQRLDEVRTGSLFPEIPESLCGEKVRAFTLTDWLVLDQSDNPFVAGGRRTVAHAANIVWQLSPRWRADCRFARIYRRFLTFLILARHRFDEDAVIEAVERFVDDAFLDSPGRFVTSATKGTSPVNWPRKSFARELAGEIMAEFPQFTFETLRKMPLAQFWQWLHEARSRRFSEYRNYQLTDSVNTAANAEVNRMKQELASRN